MSNGLSPISKETRGWVFVILAVAFASLLMRLKVRGLDAQALASVAVPSVLAMAVVLAGPAATLTARYLKNTTLVLLLVGILYPEKFPFLLVVAPVAWLLAYLAAYVQQRPRGPRSPMRMPQPGVVQARW